MITQTGPVSEMEKGSQSQAQNPMVANLMNHDTIINSGSTEKPLHEVNEAGQQTSILEFVTKGWNSMILTVKENKRNLLGLWILSLTCLSTSSALA